MSCPSSQTFLLKVVEQNADRTISVTKTVPCDAGEDKDICVVEVSSANL